MTPVWLIGLLRVSFLLPQSSVILKTHDLVLPGRRVCRGAV